MRSPSSASSRPARTDVEDVLEDARPTSRVTARAQTVLGDLQQMEGDYAASDRDARTGHRQMACSWATPPVRRTRSAARGGTVMFQGDLDAAESDMSEALERSAASATAGARRGRCRTSPRSRSSAATPTVADDRLAAAADMFRDLDDWGGLNWTFAVLAWVRFMQGRLDEAEVLAREQLPESEATGNRWVAGILDMLLGSISLWSGADRRGRDPRTAAVARFQALRDPWGENQARRSSYAALGAAVASTKRSPPSTRARRDVTRPKGRKIGALVRAQVLVHSGAPRRSPPRCTRGAPDEGWTLAHEYRMVLGLALVQAGRSTRRSPSSRTPASVPSTPGRAGRQRRAGVVRTRRRRKPRPAPADGGPARGTYLDQHPVRAGGVFARLQARAPDAVDGVRRRRRGERRDGGPPRPGDHPARRAHAPGGLGRADAARPGATPTCASPASSSGCRDGTGLPRLVWELGVGRRLRAGRGGRARAGTERASPERLGRPTEAQPDRAGARRRGRRGRRR